MGSKAMKWIWLSVVCTFPLQFHEMGYLLIVWNRIVTKHIFTKYTDSERELLHSVDSSCLPYETVHFPSSHVPSPSNSQHPPPNRFFLLSSATTPINRINISLPSPVPYYKRGAQISPTPVINPPIHYSCKPSPSILLYFYSATHFPP